MPLLELLFWLCAAVVGYTYVGYPLLLALLTQLFGRPRAVAPLRVSVSFLMPVHNEEANLPRRLAELTQLLLNSGLEGEILVVSDASTDRSAEIVRSFPNVKLIELTEKSGKAVGLQRASAVATGDLLIFADARQRWADDTLVRLIENFADPHVGAVSGDLVLESGPGVLAGVGLYWRFEKWLRKQESKLFAQVGVTGAISACRRELFHAPPQGTLLDDVYWPLQVALQGYRVVHDERAKAFDRLPEKSSDEFRRKVRTLAGNYQLVARLPWAALFPWSNCVWWQWVSHKLLRLVVPWALLAMLVLNCFLTSPLYLTLLALQITGYALALLGLAPALGQRVKLLGAAASFLVLNCAAWLAFWVWATGRADKSWTKAQYQATDGE